MPAAAPPAPPAPSEPASAQQLDHPAEGRRRPVAARSRSGPEAEEPVDPARLAEVQQAFRAELNEEQRPRFDATDPAARLKKLNGVLMTWPARDPIIWDEAMAKFNPPRTLALPPPDATVPDRVAWLAHRPDLEGETIAALQIAFEGTDAYRPAVAKFVAWAIGGIEQAAALADATARALVAIARAQEAGDPIRDPARYWQTSARDARARWEREHGGQPPPGAQETGPRSSLPRAPGGRFTEDFRP